MQFFDDLFGGLEISLYICSGIIKDQDKYEYSYVNDNIYEN